MGEMIAENRIETAPESSNPADQNTTPKFFEKPCYESVRDVIRRVQSELLAGKKYSSEDAKKWSTEIVEEVNKRLRKLKMRRYKHIVQVILTESKGAELKTDIKSVWDPETDAFTSETFLNDTMICVITVFTILLY